MHEKGRDYVLEIKNKLESLDRYRLPFNVYVHPYQLKFQKISSKYKSFDLKGWCQLEKKSSDFSNFQEEEVIIESKKYSDYRKINGFYNDFLIDSFEIWLNKRLGHKGWKSIFLFISNLPFHCQKHPKLRQISYLKEIVEQKGSDEAKERINDLTEDELFEFLKYIQIFIINDSCKFLFPFLEVF